MIQLSITKNYAGHWGTWEGVREMVQNWHDGLFTSSAKTVSKEELKFKKIDFTKAAETPMETEQSQEAGWASRSASVAGGIVEVEAGSEASCYYDVMYEPLFTNESSAVGHFCYDFPNKSLTMINKDIALHRRCLLIGYTDKKEEKRQSIIGQFGEGMKIGALALLRNKRHVTVRTSQDSWRFGLRQHSVLMEEVLTVFVSDRGQEQLDFDDITPPCTYQELSKGDTCTQIWPITEEEWMLFSRRFLFLERPSECVNTDLGTLLLDVSLRGQLYTREIWIQDMSEDGLDTGVNIYDIEIDRDRNSVTKKSDIEHRSSCIWVKAVKQMPKLSSKYFDLLTANDKCDVRHASLYLEEKDKEIACMLVDRFFEKHGKNAYPVENNTPHEKVHLLQQDPKREVVLCNSNLMKILKMSGRIANLDDELEKLAQQKQQYVNIDDLTDSERTVFDHGMRMVRMVEQEFPADAIAISTSDAMGVLYTEDSIEIPRWMLSTESVHAKRTNCGLRNCFCAATVLSTIILQTWQGGSVNIIARHMMLTSQLAAKSCEIARAKHNSGGEYHTGREGVRYVTDHEMELITKREKELERSKSDLQKQFADAQKQNERAMEGLKGQLEDVNKAYEHDEIRSDTQHQDLLTRFETERTQDKAKYESLIHLKDTEKLDLEKKKFEAEQYLETITNDVMRLQSLESDSAKIHGEELEFNVKQTKVFVQRLSQKVREIHQILQASEGVKKNSNLQEILAALKKDIEASARMDQCFICNLNTRNCAFDPCGHSDICMSCAETLMENKDPCHHCRKPITKLLHTYS